MDFNEDRDWKKAVCKLDAWDKEDTLLSLNLLEKKLKHERRQHDDQMGVLTKSMIDFKDDEKTSLINYGSTPNYNDSPKFESATNQLMYQLNNLFFAAMEGGIHKPHGPSRENKVLKSLKKSILF